MRALAEQSREKDDCDAQNKWQLQVHRSVLYARSSLDSAVSCICFSQQAIHAGAKSTRNDPKQPHRRQKSLDSAQTFIVALFSVATPKSAKGTLPIQRC